MSTAATTHAFVSERASVLIASPSGEFRRRLLEQMGSGYGPVAEAVGGADALDQLDRSCFRFLVLDRHLPDLNADELEQILRDRHPDLEVILLDSDAALDDLPCFADASAAATAAPHAAPTPVLDTPDPTPSPLEHPHVPPVAPLPGMIGSSPAMHDVFRLARLVAPRKTSVLVSGQTGTGKELVARAIHDLSPRCRSPFITVNCAAIPEPLLEAELFGYSRGAFTGAVQSRLGRIHAAHSGTLFLDEAGELPLGMQAKLLRFLQYGELQRLGSSDLFRADVRVIAATNADLAHRVRHGSFRADLFYRLSVFPIDLPPLCDRPEDIEPLALAHLESLARESCLPPKHLTAAARALLRRHGWPGNVRELQHAIERAFILAADQREIPAGLFHFPAACERE